MREFALGELGWSLDRYLRSSLYEFNLAASGYWRNWERSTAWAVREINCVAIQGNPNIKKGSKPASPGDLFKLSIDNRDTKKVLSKPTDEQIERMKNKYFGNVTENTVVKD